MASRNARRSSAASSLSRMASLFTSSIHHAYAGRSKGGLLEVHSGDDAILAGAGSSSATRQTYVPGQLPLERRSPSFSNDFVSEAVNLPSAAPPVERAISVAAI